jgi:cysteinyl-tRNA synthetase
MRSPLALARRRLSATGLHGQRAGTHHAVLRPLSLATRDGNGNGDVRVWNSLSSTYEPLPRGDAVSPHVLRWYACGPTVYDHAHLGHARAYVSQDIMRRVLEKRFQHKIFLVMGVTDVDDKIIARAHERGVGFDALARDEEREFFRDMEALHVLPPSAVTRVSEHMDDIVQYIATIQQNGFAYEAADGVYFHTKQLGDGYGKLDPSRHSTRASVGDEVLEEEDGGGSKRDKRDFALWKATKDSVLEPSWNSPWGSGRPGWHIECSAMIHRVLGERLDVHSGGIDLAFPHHNNEIAQCEAHNHNHNHHGDDWCRHFIHFGHLSIRGLKMSKSLKNFISIKDFLAANGAGAADQFRIFCLQYKYRAHIHYSEDRMRDAAVVADRLRNFLRNLDAYGTQRSSSQLKRCEPHDLAMLTLLFDTRVAFDAALRDDVDTPTALSHVLEMLRRANEYLLPHGTTSPSEVLWTIASFVLDVLDVFGLETMHREFAYLRDVLTTSAQGGDASSVKGSVVATPPKNDLPSHDMLQSLVEFRAAIRELALRDPSAASNGRILRLCDALRDDHLPTLGVQLEDLAPGRSVFKLLTAQEREALQDARFAEHAAESQKREALAARQQEFDALMQIRPDQLFRQHSEFAGKYSQFDEDGVPTHDAETNAPLTKSQRKKLLKKYEKHAKSHAKYWAEKGAAP